MNLVERFFAGLTGDVVRDGSFTSVAELTRSIEAYLAQRNRSPKPHRWKAKGQEILEKIPPHAKLSLPRDYYYLF